MSRSAAILITGKHIALIKRRREGRLYYVFPGGQIEEGESPEQAVVREIEEELGLNVQVERLAVKVFYREKIQYYFIIRTISGTFGTGQGPEMIGLYPPERGSYRPIWMPLANLLKENVVPRQVAELVMQNGKTSWPSDVIQLNEAV